MDYYSYYYFEEVYLEKDMFANGWGISNPDVFLLNKKIRKFYKSDYYLLENSAECVIDIELITKNIEINSAYRQIQKDPGSSYKKEFQQISKVISSAPSVSLIGTLNLNSSLPFCTVGFLEIDPDKKSDIHDDQIFGSGFDPKSIHDLSSELLLINISVGTSSNTKFTYCDHKEYFLNQIDLTMDIDSLERLIRDIESKKYSSLKCAINLPVIQLAKIPFNDFLLNPDENKPLYFCPDLADTKHFQSGSLVFHGGYKLFEPVRYEERAFDVTNIFGAIKTIIILLIILIVIELVRFFLI